MSTGTKIFLAVFAAFIGVLVVYYGVLLPEAQTLPAIASATSDAQRNNQATTPPVQPPSVDGVTSQNTGQGAEPSGWTSSGGFKFDLPVAETEGPAVQPIAADPLGSALVAAAPAESASNQAGANQPPTPVEQSISPPVANQPVTLPGTSKSTRAVESKTPAQLHPPPTTEYIVKSGDTMSSIASDWFGDANKWSLIARENPNIDPARLSVGQKLRLPPKDARPAPVASAVHEQKPQSGETTYTVRSGDTLAKISREYFGEVSKWKVIYDANKGVIGSDPAALKPGMKLKMPPKS